MANYYVSTSGNDSNDGSSSHPWATFGKAASTAVAGDTVHFSPGTYTSSGESLSNSGTSGSPITFISDVKWGALFRWSSSHMGIYVGGDYVTIQGFDISSTTPSSVTIGIDVAGRYCNIIGNRIHDFNTQGVAGAAIAGEWTSSNQYTNIIGNWIYNIGNYSTPNDLTHGIYPQNYGEVVQDNIIYRCAGWGVSCYHACTNTTISNNLIFENGNGGILGEAAPSSDGNKTPPVYWDYSVVSNNIVYNNHGDGVYNSSSALVGSHNQYLNNFVYGNTGNAFRLNGNSTYTLSGNITTNSNPGFVNYQADGTGNYHLVSTSPCVGAGISTGTSSTDFDGNPRPSSSGSYDIGPYQFVRKYSGTLMNTLNSIPLNV